MSGGGAIISRKVAGSSLQKSSAGMSKNSRPCGSLQHRAFAVRTSAPSEIQRRRENRREKWSSPSELCPGGKVFARKVAGDEPSLLPEIAGGLLRVEPRGLQPPQRLGREEVTHTDKSLP